jgi:hypothetical protein
MMKTTLKLFALMAITAALCGCAEQRFYIAGYADLLIHPHNPKALIFSGDMNTGQITSVQWGRVCDVADCSMSGPSKGSGIVTATPAACYSRWWNECNGKTCRSDWWERCAKQETKPKPTATTANENGSFSECTLIQRTFYNSDPPPAIPQKPLLIYRCSRADGTTQNVYKY